MFNGFNNATMQYWEKLRVKNDKATFKDEQRLYIEGIKIPLEELYYELSNYFMKVDFELSTDKKSCISSPYNDARFCGNNPMKEYIYVRYKVLKMQKNNNVGFFFDAASTDFRYGINIYNLNSQGMEQIRSKIVEDKRKSQKIIKKFNEGNVCKLCGLKYKKSHYPEENQVLRTWLDMRTMSFEHEENINQTFFKRKLLEDMVSMFDQMQDIYFLLKEALA